MGELKFTIVDRENLPQKQGRKRQYDKLIEALRQNPGKAICITVSPQEDIFKIRNAVRAAIYAKIKEWYSMGTKTNGRDIYLWLEEKKTYPSFDKKKIVKIK